MTSDTLTSVYASMVDAAAGEVSFSDTMLKLAELNGSPGAVLFELNRKTGEITRAVSPQLEFGSDGYSEHINSINPRMRYSMRHASGHITYEKRFTNEEAMRRHEFYDWLTQTQGLKYFLGTRLLDVGDISVFHSIEFGKDSPHPERAQIDQFAQTSKRLANAWRLRTHLTPDEPHWDVAAWAPDHLPWATFALDRKGRVCAMNRAAQEVVETAGVLVCGSEGLGVLETAKQDAFAKMIKTAVRGETAVMLIESVVASTRYVAQAIPVEGIRHRPSQPIAALLYLWNPVLLTRSDPAVLIRLWGLSPTEAKIALLVARGMSLADISDQHRITRNTARNHLQNVFEKTGTSRQIELAVLLFGVLQVR